MTLCVLYTGPLKEVTAVRVCSQSAAPSGGGSTAVWGGRNAKPAACVVSDLVCLSVLKQKKQNKDLALFLNCWQDQCMDTYHFHQLPGVDLPRNVLSPLAVYTDGT